MLDWTRAVSGACLACINIRVTDRRIESTGTHDTSILLKYTMEWGDQSLASDEEKKLTTGEELEYSHIDIVLRDS